MKNKDPVRKNLYDMVKNECVRICVRVERRMFSANTFLSTHSWNIVYPFIRNKERGSPLATELMGSTLLFWRFGYLWYFLNQSTKQQRGCRSVTSLKQYSSLHVYQDCLQHEHMHTVHLYLNPYFQFRLNSAHSASSGSHWALRKPLCSGWGCSEIITQFNEISYSTVRHEWGAGADLFSQSLSASQDFSLITLENRWKRNVCTGSLNPSRATVNLKLHIWTKRQASTYEQAHSSLVFIAYKTKPKHRCCCCCHVFI